MARRSWDGFDTLPSQGLSTEQYRRLAERFAARHGLKAEWVIAADMAEIFAVIEQGRADIAVHNTTVLPSRQQRVAFSLPLTRSREWVIGTAQDGIFGVAAQTAYVESLAAHYPDAQRVPVSADADPLAFQAMLEQGVIQATIMDEAAARVVVRTSSTVKKLRELPAVHEHAWVMRKGNPVLKQVLDDYLRERHTVDESIVEYRDWRAIRNAGRLRMLTVNGPTTYYLWRGELLGFEYELVTLFAEANDLELEVIVAGDPAELVDHLLSGRGDIIAAGLTPTSEREALGARFSRPYMEIRETFVTARQPIAELADLAGRSVAVNPTTSYAATLRALAAPAPFDIRYVEQPTPTILAGVADGTYDATLADSQRAQLAATFDDQLSLGLALAPARGLAWAVREGNDELLARLDAFIAERYRGYEFNVLRNKYFVNERRMSRQREHRVTGEVPVALRRHRQAVGRDHCVRLAAHRRADVPGKRFRPGAGQFRRRPADCYRCCRRRRGRWALIRRDCRIRRSASPPVSIISPGLETVSRTCQLANSSGLRWPPTTRDPVMSATVADSLPDWAWMTRCGSTMSKPRC